VRLAPASTLTVDPISTRIVPARPWRSQRSVPRDLLAPPRFNIVVQTCSLTHELRHPNAWVRP
jgi:hypothetical protein